LVADPVLDELLGKKPVDEGPPGPILIPFLQELFTGSQRQTERAQAAPEIGAFTTGDTAENLRIATGLLTTLDPQAQANLFRDIPGVEVEEDERGNIFIMTEGQEFILNRPGASFQDTIQATAQILSFLPAARVQNVIRRMFAGAATSVGLDVAAEQLGAEGALDPVDASTRGLVAAAAEGLTPPLLRAPAAAARRIAGQRVAPAGTVPETARIAQEGLEAQQRTGVELLPAQRALIPEELLTQRVLADLPGASQKALTALNRQNEQAGKAASEFLDLIAPPRAVETGQARVRSAAQQSIENAKAIRRQKASPEFQAAFEDARVFGTKIDTGQVSIPLGNFPKGGEIHRNLTKVQNIINNADGDLQRLHNVKTEIDQLMNKTGEGGLGPTTKRQLALVQRQLVGALESQSPRYAEARRLFREASPEVDAITNSIIGKVAKVKDVDLKSISQKLLDPAEVNSQTVLNARKAIRTVDPEAWDEIVRVEIERRLGAAKVTQDAIQNEPGILVRAIFGNAKQRKVLLNALGPEQQAAANFLETALRRASLGRPGGSDTTPKKEILKRIGGAGFALRRWFSSPVESLAGVGADEAFRLKTTALARLMFDPSFKGDLKAIQRLGAEEGATRLRQILEASLQVTTAATTVAARPIGVREEDGR